MVPQREITIEEVREHAARTKHGWCRWRRTDAEGNEAVMLLRPADTVDDCFCEGVVLAEGHKVFTAHWTPLDYATEQPLAGHGVALENVSVGPGEHLRVRWNGAKVVVEREGLGNGYIIPEPTPYDPASLARSYGPAAPRIAIAACASDEYRIAVLRALIDATMAKRGCGTVRTDFNPCAGVGFQWGAYVSSNVPREGDDRRLAGRTPYAGTERGTELEALETLALFLGAAS
jgi:hypothetical protein